MNEFLYRDCNLRFRLSELDIGDYSDIRSRGMSFHSRVFDAEKAGRLFVMDMKAFGGVMRMETAVFTPLCLDGPIFSADDVEAFGRSTLVLELYDTTASHPDFHELESVNKEYSDLPSYDPGDHPYHSMRLPVSAYKKGRGIKSKVCAMAEAYSDLYFRCLQSCAAIDPTEKKERNAVFVKSLLQNGGPAVNQFKAMIGEDRTEEFLTKYMFCSV